MIYFLKTLQAISDLFLIFLGFFLAYFFRLSIYLIEEGKDTIFHSDYNISDFGEKSFYAGLFIFGILIFQKRYSFTLPYQNLKNSFFASILGVTFFILLFFFGREIFFSRLIPLYALVFISFNLFISFILWRKVFKSKRLKNKFGIKTLIIGANKNTENLIKDLQNDGGVRKIVGILDSYGSSKKDILGFEIFGKMNIFEETIKKYEVKEIIQTDNFEQVFNISNFCKKNKIQYYSLSVMPNEKISDYKLDSGNILIRLEK